MNTPTSDAEKAIAMMPHLVDGLRLSTGFPGIHPEHAKHLHQLANLATLIAMWMGAPTSTRPVPSPGDATP